MPWMLRAAQASLVLRKLSFCKVSVVLPHDRTSDSLAFSIHKAYNTEQVQLINNSQELLSQDYIKAHIQLQLLDPGLETQSVHVRCS